MADVDTKYVSGQNSPLEAEIEYTNGTIDDAIYHRVRLKVDLRLCTIAGLLCSLNLLDSGVISSASVTSMQSDLDLNVGQRYSIAIFIFTIASIVFQLPSTIAVRVFGPRVWFAFVTVVFGVITLATGFVQTWQQMMALRVLLGAAMSGIYPGLTYLISTWYMRSEQQLRFAFMQSGEVIVLATGNIVNHALNVNFDGRYGLAGWRWMFIVQGVCSCIIGIAAYWWMVDFPENAHLSFRFLTPAETAMCMARITHDRGDAQIETFSSKKLLMHALDPKIWVFAVLFFLQNMVSTALGYFVTIILQDGIGYSANMAIVLSAPPYYYAVLPVILSAWFADRFHFRSVVIVFNAVCLITGFGMLGFAKSPVIRYIGVFLATGAYVANWAGMSAYQANNIVGQWKRVFTAATCTALNGAGGIAGSYIVRRNEAPRYITAVWVSICSHILVIGFIGALSAYFFLANKAQRKGSKILEKTVGFRYTY